MIEPNQFLATAEEDFASCPDIPSLENAKAKYLGKNGLVTELLKGLGRLPAEEKRSAGARINEVKTAIEKALSVRRADIAEATMASQLASEALDVTLPGRAGQAGGVHPVTRVLDRVEAIFHSIGFVVADGPEIEDDFHNFGALNFPHNHPARAMHDTFFVDNGLMLRTHTSPVQVRYLQTHTPPIKIIAPGRVYRCDSDATHSPMFHQVEGLWIDHDTSFADLKGVFTDFLRTFFEREDLSIRFRPSYFPFVEPGVEIDMSWGKDNWLEIAGAGQVHPRVLQNVGLDSLEYQGFAFGLGLDRLAMLRYGVNDLRLFFENDLRFLRQFT